MKNLKYIPYIVIAILLFLLLVPKACNKDEVIIKQVPYKIPEKQGEIKIPEKHSEITVTKYDTVFIAGEQITVASPLSPDLLKELENAKTERDRYKALTEANREREYSTDFDDDNVSVNVKTKVFGTMPTPPEIKYKIKEQTVLVPEKTIIKKDNFGWILGAGYNNNLNTNQSYIEGNAGIRINKVYILGSAGTNSTVGGKILIEF